MRLNQMDIQVNLMTGFHVYIGIKGRNFSLEEVK